MLVTLTIENWMSFKDPVTFSLVADRERQHSGRIARIKKYNTRILPIAALYGGNASGKTNFFKALNFIKKMVVRGNLPESRIPVEPYLLDTNSLNKPSSFAVELLIDGDMYEFSFSADSGKILEEKLIVINSSSERILYHRKGGKPNFDKKLQKDMFLNFAFQGTRENQLFLTNSVSQNIDRFRPVYDWFKNSLELVAPDARFSSFELFFDENSPVYKEINEILPKLDTGISHIGTEEIPFQNIPLPEELKQQLQEDVNSDGKVIKIASENDRFVLFRKKGQLFVKKLVAFHKTTKGKDYKFEIHNESDGSQRIIDLLPAFLDISARKSAKTYVVDEIDRSLHPLLIMRLIRSYLANCTPESRCQLLFTTHNVMLMDQRLLRRDEMWVTERNSEGVSDLIAFSDYKDIRYDKDIRRSYLEGRMGGVPQILLEEFESSERD